MKIMKMKKNDPSNFYYKLANGPEDEALRLAEMIREAAAPKELIIAPHEPFTGAHVGPGMLALFFHGKKRTEI